MSRVTRRRSPLQRNAVQRPRVCPYPWAVSFRLTMMLELLAWVAFAPAVASQRVFPASADTASFTPRAWSRPMAVTGVPAGRGLQNPSLASKGDTLFIAGNILPTDAQTPPDPRPIVVLRFPGTAIGIPPGTFHFVYPRGVVAGDGSYHLFWGEPDATKPTRDYFPASFSSVWHSRFDGREWSPPEQVVRGVTAYWQYQTNPVAVDGAGRVHVVVPLLEATGPVLVYLRSRRGGWDRQDFKGVSLYASLLAWRGDSLAIAYTGVEPGEPQGLARLLTMTSGDGGAHWAPPGPHGLPPVRDPQAPTLTRSADGTLHLIWIQVQAGEFSPSGLAMWESADGGESWRSGGWLAYPAVAARFVAMSGACSGAEAMVSGFDGAQTYVDHVQWHAGRARSRRLFPEAVDALWVGVGLSGDSIRMVWSSIRRRSEPVAAWSAASKACSAVGVPDANGSRRAAKER
ncbi:MAG: repeat-like domain [Gemmatimonadetes bacterium]|nr:repeat-like domain [Gemmatimonadota bacterium]